MPSSGDSKRSVSSSTFFSLGVAGAGARNERLKSTYFRESKKFAFREDLFSRIEVFQKFREDLFSRIQSFTNFRDDLFSRNRPYKVLKKMIDCVNYGD